MSGDRFQYDITQKRYLIGKVTITDLTRFMY